MPRGEKAKYTDKQERKADHIAHGYEERCVPEKEAERRAWATVNKDDGGVRNPAPAGARTQGIRLRTRAASWAFPYSGRTPDHWKPANLSKSPARQPQ
jgi:plasmid stabilization system protein ParE